MNTTVRGQLGGARPLFGAEPEADARGHMHGTCWAAVVAGALGAASLSLILLILGVGLGLSSVSPWSTEGISAETFGISTILWLTFTQLAASAMGGYLAGRLRARWSTAVHSDEVFFRDTAHGFLAWSLATLVTAAMLSSAIGAIVSGGAKAGAALAGTAATAAAAAAAPVSATAASMAGTGQDYFIDGMFRRDAAVAAPAASAPGSDAMPARADSGAASGEVLRIFANASAAGALPPDDARYLGQLVTQRTGLSQADAEKRVTEAFSRMQAKMTAAKEDAKTTANKARKASAAASLWIFISLLVGAFVASFLATTGGRHRDRF